MRLTVDTSVFLDVALMREPLCHVSGRVPDLSARDDVELILPAHSAAAIACIVEKNRNRKAASRALSYCLSIAHVGALDEATILEGLGYGFTDVEDAFAAAIARRA